MNDYQQTLLVLKNIGLVQSHADEDTSIVDDNTPWYLQVFFGFSGILSSLLFLGFLTLILIETNILDSSIGLFCVGLVLSGAGWLMFYHKNIRRSMFWNGLAFAISGAGQIYLVVALVMDSLQALDLWVLLGIQIVMTLVMPNAMYRLLSALAALGCAVYLLSYYHIPELSLGLLALIAIVANLQRFALLQRLPSRWRLAAFDISKAVAYASAVMLLAVSVYFIVSEYGLGFDGYGDDAAFDYHYYLAQGLLTLASVYAAYVILQRYSVKLQSATGVSILCAIGLLGIMSVYVSGLLATSLVIVIAMANSQRVLLGVSIAALVGYIFWYYYQLDTSLLIKAISMLVVGIGMLLIRWRLIQRYFADRVADTVAANVTANGTANQERLL